MEFDSREELEFDRWLYDCYEAGLVVDIEYQPPAFQLSAPVKKQVHKQLKTKSKIVERHVMNGHVYTADFRFQPMLGWFELFDYTMMLASHDGMIYVDVKGGFTKPREAEILSINTKWVYDKYGIIINKVVPKKLFGKTWCPSSAFLSPITRQPRKAYANFKTNEQFFNTNLNRDCLDNM